MSREPGSVDMASMFRIDVTPTGAAAGAAGGEAPMGNALLGLLAQLVEGQQKQNQLLEELLNQTTALQRQRAQELTQWKSANPRLAAACRSAAETLGRVQAQFLANLTEEIAEQNDNLVDGEFMLQEFIDRFGPRLAHLNGIVQVLGQLASPPPAKRAKE